MYIYIYIYREREREGEIESLGRNPRGDKTSETEALRQGRESNGGETLSTSIVADSA